MPKPKFIDPDVIAAEEVDAAESSSFIDPNLPLYLSPDSILDGENVRPDESIVAHNARVQSLAKSIDEDGQQMPIKVRQTADGSYFVVDGQGRLEACRYLNNKRKSTSLEPLDVWAVLDISDDPWQTAVKLNVQRKNYTDMQLVELIEQARQRYPKMNGKATARMFGLTEQDLVNYNKLSAAPDDVKFLLRSGEISKDGALKLLAVAPTEEKREKVTKKAKELSAEEAAAAKKATDEKYAKSRKNISKVIAEVQKPKSKVEPITVTDKKEPIKVKASHIAEAARQVAEASGDTEAVSVKRNRTEILAAFSQLGEMMPEEAKSAKLSEAKAFLNGVARFAAGDFSPKQLQNRWNALVGIQK